MFEQILSSVFLLAKQRTEPASQVLRSRQVSKSANLSLEEPNQVVSRSSTSEDAHRYFCDRDQGWKRDSSTALDNLKALAARQNNSPRQARENWLRSSPRTLFFHLANSESTTAPVDPEARDQAINELLHMAYDHHHQ